MDGRFLLSGGGLLKDPNWGITQIGDFNGDGRSDLIWRNRVTGESVTRLVHKTTIVGGGRMLLDPTWSVVQVGD